MPPKDFGARVSVTHISTATVILDINGVKLLTDPVFDQGPLEYELPQRILKSLPSHIDPSTVGMSRTGGPALKLSQLPHIDGILLSHEDHVDNLDTTGRQLLNGRKVITTLDGKKHLLPRPDVYGLRPWESMDISFGGEKFHITATPCVHVPGDECTGFILDHASFGSTGGLPNVIYFSGDTINHPELLKIREKWHVSIALMSLGGARMLEAMGALNITMDGKQASQLARDLKVDIIVPMHYEDWAHFKEGGDELARVFAEEGMTDKVCWLTPSGEAKVVV